MSGRRSALVAALAFGLYVNVLHAAPTPQPEPPPLAVLLNDYAGAQPAVLELAKSHVKVIFRVAGVEIDWLDHDDVRLRDPEFLKSIVTVALYSAEMGNRAAEEESVVGKAAPGGRVVKVLYQRLEDISGGRSGETAFLFGNVIAHEIGHLALPRGIHSRVGLMVEELTISIATTRLLFFTPEQSRIIRGALAAAAEH